MSNFVPPQEISADSQTVTYKDFRLAWKEQPIDSIDNKMDKATQRSIPVAPVALSPELTTCSTTENVTNMLVAAVRPRPLLFATRAQLTSLCYGIHKSSKGFRKWEYLKLLGVTLTSEAREVHSAFMDEWNFVERGNPNYR